MVCPLDYYYEDCGAYRKYVISTWEMFEEWKKYFENNKSFKEISKKNPYNVLLDANNAILNQYPDKLYIKKSTKELYEVLYPDFPAFGFVKIWSSKKEYYRRR